MKNILKSLAVILFSALSIAQNLPNISTQTKGQLPINRLNAPGVAGLCLQTDGLGNVTVQTCASGGGSGTVTNFSAGDLAPLFTTSVSNPSTIPSLSFSLSTALAHKFFGNNTASTTSPDYVTIGNGDLPGSGGITLNTTAPITGGGLVTLGGSLTFACPSCLASVTAHNLLSATHGDTTTHTVLRGDLIAGIGAVPTWTAVAKGGTNAYPKWNASGDVVSSTLAASGVGSPTSCTNQAITAFTLNADAAPTSTCTTITSAFTSGTFTATAHNLLSATHGDTTAGSVVTGDVISGQSSAWARLAGNSTTTPQYLKSLGSGAAANAPSWAQVAYTDLSGVPSTFAPTAHNILSTAHGDTTAAAAVRGDGFFAIGVTPTWQRLAHPATTGGYFKWNGTDIVASSLAASGTGNCGANQFETGSNADAAPTCAQPSFANLSGSVAAGQMPALTGDVTSTAGTVATALATVATPGTSTKVTFNAKGLVTSGTSAVLASADFVNQGTTTTLLHGNAAGNPAFAGVNLINDALANQGTVNQLLHGNAAGQPSFSAVASADLNLTTTTCTNQFVTAISAGGVGTCTTDTLASAQHANQGTVNTVLHGNAAGNPAFSAVTSADTTGTFTATAHNLLSSTHGDSTTGIVARGDIITGQGVSPTWTRLAKGTANQVLSMDGTGTDVLWTTVSGTGTVTNVATTSPITGGPITTTGTIACATCVTSTTPGAGVAHFAGATQAVTSSAVDVSGADITGVLKAAAFPALTGDVTTSAGALATTIAANAVTQTKVTNGYVDLSSTQASIAGAKGFTTSVATPKINGAVYCDGVTNANFNAAVTAAGTTGTVIVTNGSVCSVTGNVTVGSGVTTIFQTGTAVAIPTATTVTFNGPLVAPPVNIFSFTGTAALVVNGPTRELYPEWWGAKGDNSTDDTTAINNALANANSVDGQRILLSSGKTYVSASTISLLQFTSVRMGGSGGVGTFNSSSPVLKFTGNPAAARYIDARSTQAIELDHMIVLYTNTSFAGRVIDLQHSIASDSQNFYIHDVTVMGTSTAKLAICLICADNTDMGVVERDSFFWAVHAVEALNANIFTLRNCNFGSGNVGVGDIGGDYITDLGNNSWIGPANNFEMSTNNKAINCSTCGNNVTIFGNTFNDFVAGYNVVLITVNSSSVNVQDNHVATGPGSTSTFFSGAGAQGTFNLTGNTLGNWGTAWIGLNGPAKSANINNNSYGTITTFLNICCPTSGIVEDNAGIITIYSPNIKYGQADTVADSGAINTTETIIVKTPALAASRLIVGTHIRMTLTGTCTSSAANVSTFTVRMGTNGTTADTSIAAPATAVAAVTGTNIPFKVVLDFTIRTTGASATGFITLELANQGTTGIATTTEQLIMPSMSTFNTTTANNILSVSYKSAASTTTSTFKQGVIEIIQN